MADVNKINVNGTDYDIADATAREEITELNQSIVATKNGIFRGKYLGTAVTDAQWEAISKGTFDDLYIGDYWTINGYDWVIADFDYYYNYGDTQCTDHHILVVPRGRLYAGVMNNSNITTGAYVGSVMYVSGLSDALSIINSAFGSSHILEHSLYFQNAVTSGYPSGGAWSMEKLEIMNEEMAFGCPIRQQTSYGGTGVNNATVGHRQLSLFRLDRPSIIAMGTGAGESKTSRYAWWLRDVYTASTFCFVGNDGNAATNNASTSNGVRPAFCIY